MENITIHRTNELPLSPRTYIDSRADEFKSKDSWTKLAHLGHLIKQGIDLLPEFKNDIKRHKQNPQYGDYEDTAKSSIGKYISLLRSGVENDYSWVILPKKMDFAGLFRLLTEEILYRYWEEDGTSETSVTCNFDEALYDYKEIKKRFENTKNPKVRFMNYLKTSKETLRKIDVDEYSLREKNGWALVAKELDKNAPLWSDTKQYLYPGDKEIVERFNSKVGEQWKHVIGIPPCPFAGNPLSAKVVVLTLNPGYREKANKDYALKLEKDQKDQKDSVMSLLRDSLIFKAPAIYNADKESRILGDNYWEKSLERLAQAAYGKSAEETGHKIYEDVALLQYIGYQSISFKYTVDFEHLPSAIYRNLLVKFLATKTNKTLLVLRAQSLWKTIIGEELWQELVSQGRIVTKGHNGQSQCISEGNIKNGGFQLLVNALKQN